MRRIRKKDTPLAPSKNERSYVVRENTSDKVTVLFGDGKEGKHLPKGADNANADYGEGAHSLQDLLEIIDDQFKVLRQNIDELRDNFVVKETEPWVLPYINDLLSTLAERFSTWTQLVKETVQRTSQSPALPAAKIGRKRTRKNKPEK